MTDEIVDDDVDDDDAFDEVETTVETEVETEVEAEKVEAETETKVEVEGKEEPTSSKQKSVPVAALQDERKKRQTAEERASQLEKELESLRAKPEPISDSEFDVRVRVSAEYMKEKHADYSEMEKIFMDQISRMKDGKLVIKNEDLWEQYRASKKPAEFAYNHAKSHKDYLDKTAPDYEEKLRKQLEEKILADLKKRKIVGAELPNLTSTAASELNTESTRPGADDDGIWD